MPDGLKGLEISIPFSKSPNAILQISSRLKLRIGHRLHCDLGQSMANQSAEVLLMMISESACSSQVMKLALEPVNGAQLG